MKKFKWSKVLVIVEQLTYVFPTFGTVLYYYFAEIQKTVSLSSKYTFALAVSLFVLFLVYKAIMKRSITELRQSVVQTATDLKNTPDSNAEIRKTLAENLRKDTAKRDLFDRGSLMISLVIFALAINILEKALIGLTSIVVIACGSVLAGFGVHLGVLGLKKKESLRRKDDE